ncbi:MAG: nuclear transport factor 2 family protein [Rhodospirillaceae bacterium]|nr:nuclear transport factor 2 family protein [Rhodospirillaceae bacterium]
MDTPESILALAKKFVAAIMAKDIDSIREVYAPGAKIWHNFDGIYQTVDDNIKGVHWIHKVLTNVNYDVKRIQPFPGGYLQEHVLRGKLATGEDFAMPACVICTVVDGKITALDEYLDSRHTKPLVAANVSR